MSDCIIVQVTGTNVSAITNYAQTAAATGTATTTAYSTTVTTGLATSQAAVGQSIVIVGAAGTGATPLVGKIKSVNSVAGTLVIENLDNSVLQASQSVTSHTATLYNRDSNVRIIGGNWQFGSNSSGGNVPADNHILLRHIDGYSVDLQAASSSGKGYIVSVADATNGWGRLRNLNTTSSNGDGWHVLGPHYGLTIDEISGITGDDSFAITANDYPSQCDCSGNVYSVTVNRIDCVTNVRSAAIIAGVYNYVDDIHFVDITGIANSVAAAVTVGDDAAQANTTGGTYGYIDLGTISAIPVNAPAALGLISPSAARIKAVIDFIQPNYGYSVTEGALVSGSSSTVIDTLDITASINAAGSGTVVPLALTSTTCTVNQTFMNGRVWNGTTWLGYYNNPSADTQLLASGEQTISRYVATNNGLTPTSGDIQYTFFTAKKTHRVTTVTFPTNGTGSSGLTAGYVGLYSLSGTTLTQIAISANTTTLMNGTYGTSAITIPTTTLIAGTTYVLAIIMVGTTMPVMSGLTAMRPIQTAPYLSGKVTGQTVLPSSTTISTLSGNQGTPLYAELTP